MQRARFDRSRRPFARDGRFRSEAPYRDLRQPLLRHLRALTADGDTTVLVLMPEVVVRGWRRLLHNQRALYLKRLLLFEPNVILASVPYQLLK